MSDAPEDEERIAGRADLLPEEQEAGSEDAHHQAEAILRDSDERTEHPEETGRDSTQTSTPEQRPSVLSPDEESEEGPDPETASSHD